MENNTMSTLHEVRENFRNISQKVRDRLPRMLEDTQDVIISLNQDQLSYGLNSKNNDIYPEYRNRRYATKKNSMNSKPKYGTPDLKLKGGFYRGFKLDVRYNSFEVDSSNSKTEDLVKKYGIYIFGLSSQSKEQYAKETLHEEIREYIRRETGV